MNIQSEKQNLIEWISSLEDETAIETIKEFKDSYFSKKDWWDEISEEEKISIDRGLKDAEEGRVISYERIKDKYKNWLSD
jgi:predicted transcriptional regulator